MEDKDKPRHELWRMETAPVGLKEVKDSPSPLQDLSTIKPTSSDQALEDKMSRSVAERG